MKVEKEKRGSCYHQGRVGALAARQWLSPGNHESAAQEDLLLGVQWGSESLAQACSGGGGWQEAEWRLRSEKFEGQHP